MTSSTWSLTLNDDGTATARLGAWSTTVPVEVDENGQAFVRVALDTCLCLHPRAYSVEATSYEDLARGVRTFTTICPDCDRPFGWTEKPLSEDT
jgi:hypothetical protein